MLFLTQAEGGAPGYLSQLGEDGALALAETLSSFVGSLGLDLSSGSKHRAGALEGLRKAGQSAMSVEEGLRLAREICADVLVCSGGTARSQKTLAPFVESLALPTVLVESLDRAAPEGEEPGAEGLAGLPLATGLERVFVATRDPGPAPRLVIVQTSLRAISQWLPKVLPEQGVVAAAMLRSLHEVSEGDRIPALAALGFEGPWPGRWLLDPGES